MNLGPTELIIVLLIILLIFGGAKLPKLARSMGQASKEFKQGLSEGVSDDDEDPGKPSGGTAAKASKPSRADRKAGGAADPS